MSNAREYALDTLCNTGKHAISGLNVSVVHDSLFIFVHRGSEYCRVVTQPTASSIARVQRAQLVLYARGTR